MTAPKSELRKFIDQTQSLPDDCVLGNILWYSVEDRPYDAAAISLAFDLLGLSPALLPPPIKPINAFEKATSEATGKQYPMDKAGLTAELMCREVARDDETVTRQITREVKDTANHVLSYDKVAEMVFYKEARAMPTGANRPGSSRMRTTIDPGVAAWERALLKPVLDEVDAQYIRYRDFLDGAKIRGVLRDYVAYLNGVMMRAGVYFVHSTRTSELEALQQFCKDTDGTSMALFPLPDLKVMREEVIEAYQVEAEKELNEVLQAIQKVRTSRGRLTLESHRKIKEQYNGVMRKATEYGRTLKVSQERTAAAAELAADALIQFEVDIRKQMDAP